MFVHGIWQTEIIVIVKSNLEMGLEACVVPCIAEIVFQWLK